MGVGEVGEVARGAVGAVDLEGRVRLGEGGEALEGPGGGAREDACD